MNQRQQQQPQRESNRLEDKIFSTYWLCVINSFAMDFFSSPEVEEFDPLALDSTAPASDEEVQDDDPLAAQAEQEKRPEEEGDRQPELVLPQNEASGGGDDDDVKIMWEQVLYICKQT